jgi:hypothetical protein
MKPTLEEMCLFLTQELALELDPIKHLMLEAIRTRLSKEQGRRQKANREKRLETLFNQLNKNHRQNYQSIKLKVLTG